ncbi:MAG: RNA 2',3'-cyclic phosphodiesterase [Anaerolineales bacterium]|nr:MAG: RNA 2',3'-cyclic phosphodiesterase [Anaerolineales bacterium]
MSVVRSFIAIDLPDSLFGQLERVSDNLQELLEGMPIRWIAVPNIHLTLKFLGDVSEKNIPMIKEILKTEAASHKHFEISVGGFGVFPNFTRPRVIWVGVEAPDELENLQRRIDLETARLGYVPDRRKYNPHLTLGRVSRNANPKEVRSISAVLRKQRVGFLGAVRISEVNLFRSDLGPRGAVYTKMFTAPIGQN